jgi:uroporphyrinogen decarboxylase
MRKLFPILAPFFSIDIGLKCFNPFQPKVMAVFSLQERYHGKLAFWGGLSTQQTLPYKDVAVVRRESLQLIKMRQKGDCIFAPAQALEGDVCLENLMAFIDSANDQHVCPA